MIKNLFNALLCALNWRKMEKQNPSLWGEPENPLKMPAEDFWGQQAEIR